MAVQLELPVALPEVDWSNPLTRGLKAALVFDGGYAFDAATGKPAALTTLFGTPRVAAFPGSGELSLYTPNGSAASVFPGEDWYGPCTIIWKCYVESVDSPWGGLLVKLATGTATQLTMQRNSSNNNFYLSRNYSPSLVTGRSLSSLLSLPITFAISSESAAAAARLAIHVDGSLVQAYNPVEAQTAGAGALLLGCENSSSATYDSSVYWSSFLRFDRELSAGEIAAIGTNPRQLLVQERRIWVPVSAGGLTAVTSDAPLAWTVRNAVQLDQALAYTLRSGIQADRSLSWALRAGVQKDQSLAWTVRNTVQRDQALAYALRNAVQADRSLSWSLRNATQGDAPLAWIVRSGVLRDQALAYGVRGAAQKDQPLAWSVVGKVQKDQPLAWSVASTGTVISDQPLSWLVRSTTQRDQALAYPVRTAVQSDKPLAWSVRSTVQSDKALTWSVRNAVQRDRTLAYSILAAAQHDQSLSWLVRSRVQHDQPLAWVMRSGIQQDQPLAFPIRGATQQDRPLSWSVLTSAVADASLSWIMRAGVSRDQGIAYQVYSIAQRDQALAWTVASSVALPAVICITVEPFYAFQQSEIVDVWRLNGSIEPVLRGCDS